jgi:TonB family protein
MKRPNCRSSNLPVAQIYLYPLSITCFAFNIFVAAFHFLICQPKQLPRLNIHMKLFYMTLFLVLSHTALRAQATAAVDLQKISGQGTVEIPASFPRGTKAMVGYINAKLIYPSKAKTEKRGGYSFVQFTVERDGTLSNFKVLKGEGIELKPTLHLTDLDEEALSVIKSMPKWIPAKNKGEQVEVAVILSIKFTPDK